MRAKQIGMAVGLTHLLAILALLGHHFISRQLKPARPMIVRTAQMAPPTVISTAKVAHKPQPPAPVAKKTTPVAPKPVPAKKKTEIVAPKKVETKPSRPELFVPQIVAAPPALIKTPAPVIATPTYGEFLITYLQSTLDLPEYGEVRASLQIDRFGRLIDCQILEAKSAKNADFLRNELPNLTFPCLNDFDIIELSQTFTITFRNVETR